jgi:homopolymeric O-antigen transport system permease protein
MAVTSVEQGFELRGERSRVAPLLRDLWRSRALMEMLARKDFFVRYRRASLGMIWAIGLPLVQATVYAVVLSQFVRFETAVDFPVFVFSGVLPWTFFSTSVTMGTNSVVDGSALATKIYFPRPVFPLVTVLSGFYGLVPGVVILVAMTAIMGNPLGLSLLLLIPAMALLFVLSSAFALVLAVMEVYFRDMKHVIGAVTLPWFWASGVFYPMSRLSPSFRRVLEINPPVGMISLFRASIGAASPGWETAVWWSAGWAAALLVVAVLLYRRYDRVCVDLL